MRILPIEYKHAGLTFRQVKRTEKAAMFKAVERDEWEVVRIQFTKKPHTWPNGTVTEAGETMPGSTQWGIHGWTCSNERSAEKRFNSIA